MLASCASLPGTDWIFLARSRTGVPLYYDPGTVTTSGRDTVLVRTKAVFTEAESPLPGLEDYSSSVSLIEINCTGKTLIIRETTVFDRRGNSFSAYSPKWEDAAPEPQIEKLLDRVCPPENEEPQRTR